LYALVDEYFAEVAREYLQDILFRSSNDSALAISLPKCYKKYEDGASRADRMLNYINRLYVRREIDEGRGWVYVEDIVDKAVLERARLEQGKSLNSADVQQQLEAWKEGELHRRGFDQEQSDDEEEMAKRKCVAEKRAEAGSKLGAVVPIKSMALRRFRMEVGEPLL
ncbi:hypothetical protein CONPUDRAFT_37533, partial [Coniophora puteana RWD-64-598 SS2]